MLWGSEGAFLEPTWVLASTAARCWLLRAVGMRPMPLRRGMTREEGDPPLTKASTFFDRQPGDNPALLSLCVEVREDGLLSDTIKHLSGPERVLFMATCIRETLARQGRFSIALRSPPYPHLSHTHLIDPKSTNNPAEGDPSDYPFPYCTL